MTPEEKNAYLQHILATYKNNSSDKSLSKEEKLLLRQIVIKEEEVNKVIDQIQEKQKGLQLLDQQLLFERGQISGLVDALLSLKQ